MDEYLDLVDENDRVIGKKLRSEVYKENLSNFRVINAFLVNSNGELWIPRRTADKRIFPNCLDMSVGGHVESGESYDEAFRRETLEELNIDMSRASYRLLGKLSPKDGVSAFMNVYEVKTDVAPAYNPADFIGFFWLKPEALIDKINSGDISKGDLPRLVKHFFLK
jgi:isopentenyldiphosphate isomerase